MARRRAARRRTPLWAQSVRTRPAVAVCLFVLSATAVLTSVLAPLLLRAVEQSTLADAVSAAGPAGTKLTANADANADAGVPPTRQVQAVTTVSNAADASGLWLPAVVSVESTSNVRWHAVGTTGGPGGPPATTVSRVALAVGGCAGLRVVTGRCPSGPAEAAVPVGPRPGSGSAVDLGAKIDVAYAGGLALRLRVVGVYDPSRSDGMALTAPGTVEGVIADVSGADVVVDQTTLAALGLPMTAQAARLLGRTVRVADIVPVRRDVAAVSAAVLTLSGNVRVDAPLIELLDRTEGQHRAAAALIYVTAIQALALAWFAQAIVVQRMGRARASEWGVGRLRGLPRFSWLVSIYAEPAAGLLAGAPVGLLLGVAVTRLTTSIALRPGTPVEPLRAPVLAVAALAVVGSLLALGVASARSARVPLGQLLRQTTEARELSRLAATAQSAVALLTVLTVYQVATAGRFSGGGQLGLLAPGLLALAAGLLALRLAVGSVRRVTSRPPRTLGAMVVARQLSRAPSGLYGGVVVAVGVALAVFVVQVVGASNRNQDLRADAATGASSVLHVTVPTGASLLDLVRRADPAGRTAMAVQERAASSDGGVGRVVAVDAKRLAQVSVWQAAWAGTSPAALARRLAPTGPPPLLLRGTTMSVTLSAASVHTDPRASPVDTPPDPRLLATVEAAQRWVEVELGPLRATATTYTAPIPCTTSCRLVWLGLHNDSTTPYEAGFRVTRLSTDRQHAETLAPWLRTPRRWHMRMGIVQDPALPTRAIPAPGPAGLHVSVQDALGNGAPAVAPADIPDPVPALAAAGTAPEPFAGIPEAVKGAGLDGQAQLLSLVGTAAVLPRAMGDGVLVDLGMMGGLSDPSAAQVSDEVWMTPGPHQDVERRLTAAGVRIARRESLASQRAQFADEAPTRAAVVSATTAVFAFLLSLESLVAARTIAASRRRADWDSLRMTGVTRRQIGRLALAEVTLPPLLGVLIGVLAGLLAFALTARRLPLIARATATPPLDLTPPTAALLVVTAVAVLAVGAIGATSAVMESRSRASEAR